MGPLSITLSVWHVQLHSCELGRGRYIKVVYSQVFVQ